MTRVTVVKAVNQGTVTDHDIVQIIVSFANLLVMGDFLSMLGTGSREVVQNS